MIEPNFSISGVTKNSRDFAKFLEKCKIIQEIALSISALLGELFTAEWLIQSSPNSSGLCVQVHFTPYNADKGGRASCFLTFAQTEGLRFFKESRYDGEGYYADPATGSSVLSKSEIIALIIEHVKSTTKA